MSERRVVVAFDRLDDDWDGGEGSRRALVGLLMAAKRLNDRFRLTAQCGLAVVLFLRSDVYSDLRFHDKDKYRQLEQWLAWDAPALHQLVDRRLPPSIAALRASSPTRKTSDGSRSAACSDVTFRRPRDVIQLVDAALQNSGPEAVRVSERALEDAVRQFSLWKTADLEQEHEATTVGFGALLNALRNGPAHFPSRHAVEDRLARHASRAFETLGAHAAIERLFEASVLGFSGGDTPVRFRCDDRSLCLPPRCHLHVHPALHAGLHIVAVPTTTDPDEVWIDHEVDGDTVILIVRGAIDLYTTSSSTAPGWSFWTRALLAFSCCCATGPNSKGRRPHSSARSTPESNGCCSASRRSASCLGATPPAPRDAHSYVARGRSTYVDVRK